MVDISPIYNFWKILFEKIENFYNTGHQNITYVFMEWDTSMSFPE